MGWPAEWPNYPDQGHFVLENAKWLLDKDGKVIEIPLETIEKIMINADNIEIVEFLKDKEELGGFKNES
jgi:hypothetical protein